MGMYATFVSSNKEAKTKSRKVIWSEAYNRLIFEDYLEGARYRTNGADGLALGAPATIIGIDYGDNAIDQLDSAAIAYLHAMSAAIAFFIINIGHLSHL